MDNKSKTYTVEVSANATQMLVSHASFLAKVSTDAADNLIAAFEKAANSLEFMPNRYPLLVDEHIQKNKYRYLTFGKRYMLIYQIINNMVYIDYVLDSRMDNRQFVN